MAGRRTEIWTFGVRSAVDDRETWMRDALCKSYPDVSFFPTRNETGTKAKAICARCLVSSECLDFALALGRRLDGIWGGTTQAQRVQILRHQGRGPRIASQYAQPH
ncbi:MAG: WhiB family transcriptional regulator [Acidimicrobiales bacterium]